MKTLSRLNPPLLLTIALLGFTSPSPAQSNNFTFTYQGRLKVGGGTPDPSTLFDYRFLFFDAPTGGLQLDEVMKVDVPYSDGSFTLPLILSSNIFQGPPVWVEIEITPPPQFPDPTNPAPVRLYPRQEITPIPRSWFSDVAGKVRDNSITSSMLLTDAVATVHLQNGAVTGAKIADGNVVRGLNGLKDMVTLSVEEGLALTPIGNELRLAPARSCLDYTNCYWNLLGNGNITAGVNFLGTVAGEFDPLEFRVNNTHALRIVAGGITPNLIGGHGGNSIGSGLSGSHIGGGGEPGSFNSIAGNYDTIGGGSGNAIQKPTDYATIGGGNKNLVETNSSYSTIGGGDRNTVDTNAPYATVGGGAGNRVGPMARWGTVAGGVANSLGDSAGYSFIGGGTNNSVLTAAAGAVIAGGTDNRIQQDADNASVGGGQRNTVGASTPFATIPGGLAATVDNYGQFGYASGAFTTAGQGEAQLSFHVLRRTLTSVVTNELFLDGDAATRRMVLRPEATWAFDILVSARSNLGLSAGYRITGLIRRPTAGAISFVGAPVTTLLGNDIGGGGVFVAPDAVNNALVIKAVGAAVPTRWVATVRTTEVIY